MGRVVVDISVSIDGYIAGEAVTVREPFGDAGHRLHRWLGLDTWGDGGAFGVPCFVVTSAPDRTRQGCHDVHVRSGRGP